MAYDAFGDSVTNNHGVTLQQGYPYMLSQNYSINLINHAVDGDMAIDQSWKTFGFSPSDFTTIMCGINDSYQYGNDAAKRGGFITYLRSTAILSAGLNITPAKNMTQTGSWQVQGAPDNMGIYTTSANDYITGTFKGTALYIGRFFYYAYSPVFEVYVDNVLIDTVTDTCANWGPSGNGRPFATGVTRYHGFTNTTHTVKLVYKSGGLFMPEFIAGNASSFQKPVFVSNVIRKQAAGYGNGDSDTNIQNYCNDVAQMVTDLQADGLKIYLVDNHASINPLTDLGDVTHPNAAGHVKLYNNFKTSIDTYLASLSSGGGSSVTFPTGTVNKSLTLTYTCDGAGGITGPYTLA